MRIETDEEFMRPPNCLVSLGYILQGELLQNSSALYISITSLQEQAFFLGTSHRKETNLLPSTNPHLNYNSKHKQQTCQWIVLASQPTWHGRKCAWMLAKVQSHLHRHRDAVNGSFLPSPAIYPQQMQAASVRIYKLRSPTGRAAA